MSIVPVLLHTLTQSTTGSHAHVHHDDDTSKEVKYDKLTRKLSEEQVGQVEDFAEFLRNKKEEKDDSDRVVTQRYYDDSEKCWKWIILDTQ